MHALESVWRQRATCAVGAVALSALAVPQDPAGEVPPPQLVTAATRANAERLAALEKPGEALFRDEFESQESLSKYFEVRGAKDGRALITIDPELAHRGKGALQLISRASEGRASGAGVSGWLGDVGHERLHLRYYVKFDVSYDQGNLNHTGGGLVGVAGTDKWAGMGSAGVRPTGRDRFTVSLETWRDWGRVAAPGAFVLYTYWMDMALDRDGHYWGNLLGPETDGRRVPERGRWYCCELMVRANTPGLADGELAVWIDGELYSHHTGIRWRSSAAVQLKRFGLDVYVHSAERDNTVWYDDVVVSTGYVGPQR